jgi:hypothetical protein
MQEFAEIASVAEEVGLDRFPADALIAFHAPGLPAIVADILDVQDNGDSYAWMLQMAPSNATFDAPETGCRSPTQVYHHPTRCLAIETDAELDASSLQGNGMTAFVKVSSVLSELQANTSERSNRAVPQLKMTTNMSQGENSSADSCPEGSHKTPLNTYFVTMDSVTVKRLAKYSNELGSFIEVGFPKSRLPASVPFVKSDMEAQRMFEDVLNSTEFFSTWAKLATKASPLNGTFAMPGLYEASECFERYRQQVLDDDIQPKGIEQVPANAMLVFDGPGQDGVVADVFDVIDNGDSYLWHLRVAPSQAPMDTREGECHPYQSLETPHYHHVSRCLGVDFTSPLDMSLVNGTSITAFVRLGPLIDTGIVAVGADLIGSAGADAAVDVGADVASDAASDVASDVASDAGSDGTEMEAGGQFPDDVASDAGSDGTEMEADGDPADNNAENNNEANQQPQNNSVKKNCMTGGVAGGVVEGIGDELKQGTKDVENGESPLSKDNLISNAKSAGGSAVKGAFKGCVAYGVGKATGIISGRR